ncbi:MAG: TonB-dependent receptor plug domain-containing protein, partial [Aquincola sp.]|nr:TonB-dependent receptor plug domain-containing protein [Aquincola sp.]
MGTAHAQAGPSTAAGTDTQTITVTGIRRGIENAINVKKNQDSIVEAVSAEDIGKLPDSSIAESIARLPGLAAQRVNGRATEVNIRGLSGDFANTLLNGREQTSTGNNRSVEFDQYPSELLSAVLVYKTPDAALVGQGLSGTIDLQTVRPLSYPQRVIALNVRGEKNGKGTPFEGTG